jgi:hypothetical protein
MGRQMRQNAVDFLLHSLEIYGALYLFYTALWSEYIGFQTKGNLPPKERFPRKNNFKLYFVLVR